jgi:hypothetical protein
MPSSDVVCLREPGAVRDCSSAGGHSYEVSIGVTIDGGDGGGGFCSGIRAVNFLLTSLGGHR